MKHAASSRFKSTVAALRPLLKPDTDIMHRKFSLGTLIAAIGLVAGSLTSGLAHAELFVISNSANLVAPGEIKDVYTGEKQFSGPVKLAPADNGPAQEVFLENALKMSAARYNTIWTKKSFREGLNPPPVKSGDTEVLDFVRKTPGAIGYVSTRPSGVNIVYTY